MGATRVASQDIHVCIWALLKQATGRCSLNKSSKLFDPIGWVTRLMIPNPESYQKRNFCSANDSHNLQVGARRHCDTRGSGYYLRSLPPRDFWKQYLTHNMDSTMSLSTMSPPLRASLGQTQRYSTQEWEAQRPRIERLYIGEQRTLNDVISVMKQDFGFVASYDFFQSL